MSGRLDTRTSAEARKKRRRVTDENRKRAARAERSPSPLSASTEPSTSQELPHAKSPTQDLLGTTAPSQNHELFSPASEVSQGLSRHVVADQTKKVLWPAFLSRLREAFSLDTQAAIGGHDMAALQASPERTPPPLNLSDFELRFSPPRQVADFLISVFINHGTDSFFYLDQNQFLSELDQYYTNPASPLRWDAGFVCLAMASFALGSQWTPLERPETSSVSHLKENLDVGRHFYRHAKALVPDIIEKPCIRSIQAVFVLGVYLMPASAIGSSYVYMGLALRKALAADLHVQSEDIELGEVEREVRRRLVWSIYSLERCTSIKLNRPRSISADVITIPLPAPCEPFDRVQKYDNIKFQMAYTRFILIFDRIAGLSGDLGMQERDRTRLEADLKNWKKSLPSDFHLEHMPKSPEYRTIFHLHINYYYAWISLGKVALVTAARSRLRQILDPDSGCVEVGANIRRLAQVCTKAARKMLALFESLSRTNNITRFSFTDFQACSIATIVTLIAGILDRDVGYESRVKLGFECLVEMAKGNTTAKLGVKFVQAVQSITNEAAEKLRRATVSTENSVGTSSGSEYNQWAAWIAVQERAEDDQELSLRAGMSVNVASRQAELWQDLQPAAGIPWETDALSLGAMAQSNFADQAMGRPLANLSTEDGFFTGFQGDETFLMGLTGLDSLDL
ncbi:hypothetical protein N7468_001336 [Penicillium chermesinum]|uniref:Xylanolytic transcriptional activator regulatory domain-containing protein n=1 Tax=Penicillium chermesinum TaxID=63820 RepID=A0A9W9TX90_9EURO|nr:uncharacterized protein N7468_001336 [Penicillium chermesinum]KAJ5246353.1 hypothetical protein N7468_001336 [Penicillium chermesinum]